MSSPLFDPIIMLPVMQGGAGSYALFKAFYSKGACFTSFISRTLLAARLASKTTKRIDACLYVLNYLTDLGYLFTKPFKLPTEYCGKPLYNYFPTDSFNSLMEPGFAFPPTRTGGLFFAKSEPIKELTDAVDPITIEVTGKRYHLMKSAAERKKEFNLSYTDVKRLVQRKTCYYTGIPFSTIDKSPFNRTIDRVDNSKGYVKGNVVSCCDFVNQFKNKVLENGSGLNLSHKVKRRMLLTLLDSLGEEE